MDMSEETQIAALGQGINLMALRESLPMLDEACQRKLAAAEEFRDVVQSVAAKVGVIPGVLSQYVTSRVNHSVRKKARSAEQLSLLFSEIGE